MTLAAQCGSRALGRPDALEESRPHPQGEPLDDRWPNWMALTLYPCPALVVVSTFGPDLWRVLSHANDPVSMPTVPLVPTTVDAALLAVLGVGPCRRLRAAWWSPARRLDCLAGAPSTPPVVHRERAASSTRPDRRGSWPRCTARRSRTRCASRGR